METKPKFDRQAYMKEYYRKNREKIRERARKHYYDHADHHKQLAKERYYKAKGVEPGDGSGTEGTKPEDKQGI